MSLENKKVVVFSPLFFDYPDKICNELQKKGADVLFFNERPLNSTLGKALIRLNITVLTYFIIRVYYIKKLKKIICYAPDYILFINPESIRKSDLIRYKHFLPNTKFIIYMWDSFINKSYSKNYLDIVDNIYTFDEDDANLYKIKFLPLFYIKEYEDFRHCSIYKFDYCFIGTIHSDRVSLVKKIILNSSCDNFLFFYCPSKILFLWKRFFTKQTKDLNLQEISFKPIKKEILLNAIASSRCIIDISHPNQSGLTMRTIESIGANKKIITNNHYIKNYDFYTPTKHLVIDPQKIYIPRNFLDSTSEKYDSENIKKYSLSSWVQNIFTDI